MRTPLGLVLAAALSMGLVMGCSKGILPTEEPRDGGVFNHLGDGPPVWDGMIQLDSGSVVPPRDGASSSSSSGNDGGGGGGDGGGTGLCGTSASTGDATVDGCLGAHCCPSFNACYADTACVACLANPSGAGCSSNTKYAAFDTCWTDNCDTSGGGGGGGGTGTLCGTTESTGDVTVDACLDSHCCTPFDACYSDASCQGCMYGQGTSCTGNSKFRAFDSCWSSNCDSGGGGGGTTANGVCDSGESTGDTTTDACLSASCCTEFNACYSRTSCQPCLFDSTLRGCGSNSRYLDFDDCWSTYC